MADFAFKTDQHSNDDDFEIGTRSEARKVSKFVKSHGHKTAVLSPARGEHMVVVRHPTEKGAHAYVTPRDVKTLKTAPHEFDPAWEHE